MKSPSTPVLCLMAFLFFCTSSPLAIGKNLSQTSNVPLFQFAPDHITKSNAITGGVYLNVTPSVLSQVVSERAHDLSIHLPINNGEALTIELEKKRLFSADFQVRKATDSKKVKADYQEGVYYHGKVKGFPNSLVALSFFEDKIMGVVSYNGDDYNLGIYQKGKHRADDVYVFYPEGNLLQQQQFNCHTPDDPINIAADLSVAGAKSVTNNSVKIYFEADHQMYLDNESSVQNTTDYVTGMFNVVAAVYDIDDICIELSEVFVWTTDDPYPSDSSTDALNAFETQLNGNYNGDVAHLLSTVNAGNGGLAYVDVICSGQLGIGYSNIDDYYLGLPNYSWTVGVVAHELGHNFGSPHTHSCSWPGGAIDNCFCPEESCDFGPEPAASGGTIMSYCHLSGGSFGDCDIPTSNPGINLNAGFGTAPATLIYNNIESSFCLTACGSPGGGGGGGGGNNPELDCDAAVELFNGVTHFGNTDNGSSNISLYSCTDYIESGKEVVHYFTAPLSGTASIAYNESVAGYIDLFILDACDPNNCLTYYDGGEGVSGTVEVTEGTTYYFIADVYTGGDGGAYDLTVFFPTATPTLEVSPAIQNVSSAGGTISFSVTANTDWAVTENSNWLTVSPTSSNGNATVTATCQANSVTSSRSATLTFTGGGLTKTATINQEAFIFPPIVTTFAKTEESCYGLADGGIEMNVSGGTETFTYLWSNGATTEDLGNVQPGSYSCTITDSNGTTKTVGPIEIVAAPQLNPIIETASDITCANAQIFIDATSTPMSSGISSNWTTPNGNILSGGNTLLALVDEPGDYTLTLMYGNNTNCVATTTKTVNQIAPPVATTSTTAETDQSSNGTASVNVSGGTLPYTFLWNTTPQQTTATATGLTAGMYMVVVEDANGCIVASSVEIGQLTNTSDLPGLTQFQIAPNPTDGIVNVLLGFDEAGEVRLQIYDVLGREVWGETNSQNQWQEQIDLSDLPNSVYMVTVTKGSKRATKRLVLHR
ncbi:MAG: M12 family metallo-peptidase [Saprospiraceae bacterium]